MKGRRLYVYRIHQNHDMKCNIWEIEIKSPFICDAGDVSACRRQTLGATEEASYSEGMCMVQTVKTTFVYRIQNLQKTHTVKTTFVYYVQTLWKKHIIMTTFV